MKISQEFISSVAEKDLIMVRIMLKDSMVLDPTFVEFDELISYAESNMEDLYDKHDGEAFPEDITLWTKEFLDNQMVKLLDNFSKERVAFLKKMCANLYSEKAEKIKQVRLDEQNAKLKLTKTQIGVAVTGAGVVTTAVGVVSSKPVVTGVGIATTAVGGAIIASDIINKKKQ